MGLIFHETAQFLAPVRVAQLAEGLGLNLPDTLSGYIEILAHLLKGMLVLRTYAKALAKHPLLAGTQRLQNALSLLLEVELDDRLLGHLGLFVLNKEDIFFFSQRLRNQNYLIVAWSTSQSFCDTRFSTM